MKQVLLFWAALTAGSALFSQEMTLDEAIRVCSQEMTQKLREKNISAVAVTNCASDWPKLSSYIIDELYDGIVEEAAFTVADRQEVEDLMKERNYQMSGAVSDESMQSIGQDVGAEVIVLGSFEVIGNDIYKLRIRAIRVESRSREYSTSITIKKDKVLRALTPPRYTTQYRDYNFGERLGIGTLNLFLGLGSLIYEKDNNWGLMGMGRFEIMVWEIVGGGMGALYGWLFLSSDLSIGNLPILEAVLILGGIGYGIPALVGFGRAFFMDTQKPKKVRVATPPPLQIRLTPTASHSLGVQFSYTWRMK